MSSETPASKPMLYTAIEGIGIGLTKFIEELGGLASLLIDVIRWAVRPPFRVQNLFAQLDFVGVGSIFIVGLTGIFSGMVFAHQSWRAFDLFNAESLVGPTVSLTIT
ncbi:MAG: ABC transporter permease, partial [Archangium sp.]|nr:ABC transporter permease [Archangium sp.]